MSERINLSTDIQNYIQIVESQGFEKILEIDFDSSSSQKPEKFFVYFNRQYGILLKFDTYSNLINSGNFYYNWKPNDMETAYKVLSTGGYRETSDGLIWSGDHDSRDRFTEKLEGLISNGRFIMPWVDQPFLWLLHHQDTKANYDYEQINKDRISQFPDWVKEIISALSIES